MGSHVYKYGYVYDLCLLDYQVELNNETKIFFYSHKLF